MFYLPELVFVFCTIVAYFICFFGSKLVESAESEIERSNSLLLDLQETLNVIENSTEVLSNSIKKNNSSVQSLRNSSDNLTKNVQEVTESAIGQANSVNNISHMMSGVEKK